MAAMQAARMHSGANSTQIASVLETNTLDRNSKPVHITHPNMDQIIYDAIDDGSATALSQSLIYPGQSMGQSATNAIDPNI